MEGGRIKQQGSPDKIAQENPKTLPFVVQSG